MSMNNTTYDELCAEATAAAENRLLEHFKLHGGEVWSLGSGCQHCRVKADNVSELKKCSSCQAALFCNRDCQKDGWRNHKVECNVIATFRKARDDTELQVTNCLSSLLITMSMPVTAIEPSTAITKSCATPAVVGAVKCLGLDETALPAWFFTVDFQEESKERQKELFQTALTLYALLRDDECWTRDKESFPRSSYTHVEALAAPHAAQKELVSEFLRLNGHLLIFSAWLQHPEPPATQSTPLEDRSFYGILDSLLQISTLRDGVDAFMDNRSEQQ